MSNVRGKAGFDMFAPPSSAARVVFVLGARDGEARTVAGILQALGAHVPESDPRPGEAAALAAAESGWVRDFHDRLLRRANLAADDARPQAWLDAGELNTREKVRAELLAWLSHHLAAHQHELVIHDRALPWFLGLWRSAVLRAEATASHVLVVTPPAALDETPEAQAPGLAIRRAAGWVNHVLGVERATRGWPRRMVTGAALRQDWTVPLNGVVEDFGLDGAASATARDLLTAQGVAQQLPSAPPDLDLGALPKGLRVLVEDTWHVVTTLTEQGEDPEVHAGLDRLRAEWADLYQEAEAIAWSSAAAAGRRRRRPAEPADGRSGDHLWPGRPEDRECSGTSLGRRLRGRFGLA